MESEVDVSCLVYLNSFPAFTRMPSLPSPQLNVDYTPQSAFQPKKQKTPLTGLFEHILQRIIRTILQRIIRTNQQHRIIRTNAHGEKCALKKTAASQVKNVRAR